MKKKLYIDIDGVVGDFVAAIFSFYPSARMKNPYVYSLDEMFYPINTVKSPHNYQELYSQKNFKLYPFVGEVLRRLEFLDFELMFITARPQSISLQTNLTLAQLQFNNTYEVHHGLINTKQKLIKIRDDIILNDITHAWVIEDNPIFLFEVVSFYKVYPELKNILKTLVYLQPYNYGDRDLVTMNDNLSSVMNWKQIETEVLNGSKSIR